MSGLRRFCRWLPRKRFWFFCPLALICEFSWSLTMQHAYRHATLVLPCRRSLCLSGCTSFSDYFHHGFKVGTGLRRRQGRRRAAVDRRLRYPRPQPCRRPEPLVERFQRPRAQRPGLPCLQPEHQPEGIRHPHPSGPVYIWRSPRARSSRRRKTPPAAISRTDSSVNQLTPRHSQVLRQLEFRLQPGLGTGLLGTLPPPDAQRPGQSGRLGGELRRRAGHLVGRTAQYYVEMRAVPGARSNWPGRT